MPAPLLYPVAIAGATALNYGVQAVDAYLKDPQNVGDNASRFVRDFGKYTSSGRENPFTDSNSGFRQNADNQIRQLEEAKQLRGDRIQTGFDDAADNSYDDYKNRIGNKMATPKVSNSASKPSNSYYAPSEKLFSDYENYNQRSLAENYRSNLQNETARQNNQMQSSDRRYGTDVTAKTQQQRNEFDYLANTFNYGLQSADRRYGIDVNAKTALQNNQLQSGDRRYQTDATAKVSKYGIDAKSITDKYQWDNVNKTAIAQEQIKAGTYGIGQNDLNNRAADKYQNEKMMTYAKYQMDLDKYTRDVGNAERSYSDQRMDTRNAREAATNRYNEETNFNRQLKLDQMRQQANDRNLTRQEAANATARANANYLTTLQQNALDYALRKQAVDNQTAQINSNIALDNSRFGASRADIAYNRNYSQRSFAF
jgi:hypothetical protein